MVGFLVPLFLAGIAAVAIPVIVHLTRKRRAKVIEFPSLMFLRKVPFRDESKRRIHHWFLLAVRALAVTLLVLAFARPFFRDAEAGAAGSTGPREVVFLVDRSWSMSVGNHWERATAAVRDRIDGLGPLDRASVVFFAKGAGVAVRSTGDRARLRAALDSARPGAEATAYGPGLKLARTILEESELAAGQVVLVGDLQQAGWTGEEGVSFPAGTVVEPVRVSGETPANRSVAGVSLARERREGRERTTVVTRLVRTGGDGPEDADVVLELDEREIQRRTVTLPASGAATVTFDPFTLAERHTRGTVRFAEPDALVPDDVHHFVLSPGRALSVLLLDDGRARGEPSLYLRRALEINRDGAFDVRMRPGGGLGPAELDGVDVVVANGRPLAGEGLTSALRDHVTAGGGLVVVLGERGGWDEGAADFLPGTPGRVSDRGEGSGGRLGHLEYDHPVFEAFRGPRSGDFTGARFFRARGLALAPEDSARVLARFDDGSPALVEATEGEGRILVWTSTFDAFWTDLALQPVFLPFVQQVVRHAAGRSERAPAFMAGQVIDVTDGRAMESAGLGDAADALGEDEERVALTPGGGSVPLAEDGQSFLRLDEQGFYRIRAPGDAESRPLAVAVNVELPEADLSPLDAEEVVVSVTGGGEGRATMGSGIDALRLSMEDQERRQSLWQLLLVGAFVLLALETVLSNRISRGRGRTGRHAHT